MSVVGECPGLDCERLEGVGEAGWTLEQQWEEAAPGCPRNCQRLKQAATASDYDELTENEIEYFLGEIEKMVFDCRLGNQPDPDDLDWTAWELIRFWEQTEAAYNRIVQVEINQKIAAFLNRQQG